MENMEKKNSVESKKQVKIPVFFEGKKGGSPRIMFLGNSITKHGPLASIGWSGDWGMAASAKEKDYVHICIRNMQEKYPDAEFCIVQGAEWERNYKDYDFSILYSSAREFKPEVLVCCIGANVSMDVFEHNAFIENIGAFHKYLANDNPDTKIIISSSFFNNPKKNAAIYEYAEKVGANLAYISDIVQDKSNLPKGFEHEGVSIHPGDKGMEIIAQRVMEQFNKIM